MSESRAALIGKIINAVLNYDLEDLRKAVRNALAEGIDPTDIIEDGLGKALRTVGEAFAKHEMFIIDLVSGGEAAQQVMRELILPALAAQKVSMKTLGKVVLGTVEGDIHSIGKDLVAAMLFAAGFEVINEGEDVPTERFIQKAREVNASILGASALLTTTLPQQRILVDTIHERGLDKSLKVIVGGAPATQDWAEEIRADGYADDAVESVRLIKRLLGI